MGGAEAEADGGEEPGAAQRVDAERRPEEEGLLLVGTDVDAHLGVEEGEGIDDLWWSGNVVG